MHGLKRPINSARIVVQAADEVAAACSLGFIWRSLGKRQTVRDVVARSIDGLLDVQFEVAEQSGDRAQHTRHILVDDAQPLWQQFVSRECCNRHKSQARTFTIGHKQRSTPAEMDC